MNNDSPFKLDRFEYERKHLYYLPGDTLNLLESSKPVYIIGSRGTGKTTLLNALSWRERFNNESLKKALNGRNIFKKKYIGIYLKVSEFNVDSFNKWLSEESDDIHGPIFGFYIDLIWIEALSIALSEFILTDYFTANPSEEHQLFEYIYHEHPEIGSNAKIPRECTFRQFARSIKKIRQKIESDAKKRIDPKSLIDDFPVGQVGDLGRSVAKVFAEFCDQFSKTRNGNWHFKICLDEAECLTPFQRLVINTGVRLSKEHVSFVISYVDALVDITNTLIPKLTLQKADIQLTNLDNMTDNEFKELAEGVASIRIKKISPKCDSFDMEKCFGSLDINSILYDMLSISESSTAKNLLKKASKYSKTPFFENATWEELEEVSNKRNLRKKLPIYQTYIIDTLNLPILKPEDPKWIKRSQESREIRKKMVAAYLSICAELKTEVKYAFSEMVLQMSDKCIRDFLCQVDEIFKETALALERFVKTKIPVIVQNKALTRASLKKKESISKSQVTAPMEIGRIVDGLARLTAIVQSSPKDKALRSSERGRFTINASTRNQSTYSDTFHLIQEACEAGFLKMISNEGNKWCFRVHTSLAAYYGFSYRGAYYDTILNVADIESLRITKDPESFKENIIRLGKKLSGEDHFPLFEDNE